MRERAAGRPPGHVWNAAEIQYAELLMLYINTRMPQGAARRARRHEIYLLFTRTKEASDRNAYKTSSRTAAARLLKRAAKAAPELKFELQDAHRHSWMKMKTTTTAFEEPRTVVDALDATACTAEQAYALAA